jgi:hypothetical protein
VILRSSVYIFHNTHTHTDRHTVCVLMMHIKLFRVIGQRQLPQGRAGVLCVCVCVCVCLWVGGWVSDYQRERGGKSKWTEEGVCVCMCVCVYVFVHVHPTMNARVSLSLFVSVCVCIYMCVYTLFLFVTRFLPLESLAKCAVMTASEVSK